MELSALAIILFAALVASASPGPATIAIATLSASRGVGAGLAFATGVICGSFTWSIAAALGLSAIMLAHGWTLEIVRYAGAAYLLYLGWKAARAALSERTVKLEDAPEQTKDKAHSRHFLSGYLLHVTNPKAILFFGALYAIILEPGQSWQTLAIVIAAVGLQSTIVFCGYALLFSRPTVRTLYKRCARGIQAVSSLVFGAFALRLLTAKLNP